MTITPNTTDLEIPVYTGTDPIKGAIFLRLRDEVEAIRFDRAEMRSITGQARVLHRRIARREAEIPVLRAAFDATPDEAS